MHRVTKMVKFSVEGQRLTDIIAQEQLGVTVHAILGSVRLDYGGLDFDFDPICVAAHPPPDWLADQLAENLTSRTRLPWVYQQNNNNDAMPMTYLVPLNIDTLTPDFLCRTEGYFRELGIRAQVHRPNLQSAQSLHATSPRSVTLVAGTHTRPADDYQQVRSKETIRQQNKERKQKKQRTAPCRFSHRCVHGLRCDNAHTDAEKDWFRFFQDNYRRRNLDIQFYKSIPCKHRCEGRQCIHDNTPWRCFWMHNVAEAWCTKCRCEGRHPTSACTHLTDEERSHLIERNPQVELLGNTPPGSARSSPLAARRTSSPHGSRSPERETRHRKNSYSRTSPHGARTRK